MEKNIHAVVGAHRARCSLCASPNKERHEADLLAGADIDEIRSALRAEIKKSSGKSAAVSRAAIIKHMELRPYLPTTRGLAEAGQSVELSDEEIMALPMSYLQERCARLVWAAISECVAQMCRSAYQTESLDDVMYAMRTVASISQVLAERRASQEQAAASRFDSYGFAVERFLAVCAELERESALEPNSTHRSSRGREPSSDEATGDNEDGE